MGIAVALLWRSSRLASVLFAILAIVPLTGCASWGKQALSVKETPPPELLGAKDIDPLMRKRILSAVDEDVRERALRDELERQPDNVDAAIRLAKALLAQKRPKEALEVLDRVLLTAPGNLRALNAKGVVLDIEARHDAAQALYRQALENEPGNQMLLNNLNRSLALDGKSGPNAPAGSQ
ncbi:tetratricopeptide repeat protein [Rhizobium etli]|uniref:tetratricopeptide repeat protein n=1 Tax=Rhizobium etli TaxID=29449 RepID=UPI0003839A0A|nr:tetratricopeptide repeat protein [Rhizobium etli]AGS25296.1 tetratricopeptide repeat-containing protein [Rhizobium etli bv. mimosae str. Mim1]